MDRSSYERVLLAYMKRQLPNRNWTVDEARSPRSQFVDVRSGQLFLHESRPDDEFVLTDAIITKWVKELEVEYALAGLPIRGVRPGQYRNGHVVIGVMSPLGF